MRATGPKIRQAWKLLLAITIVSLAFWIFFPSPHYDITRVEPRLLSLATPYQSISAGYSLDYRGVVNIRITDRDGRQESFAISTRPDESNLDLKVFVGAPHDRLSGAVEVADPLHTRRMLTEILASSQNRTMDEDYTLVLLRGRPLDHFRCLWNKLRGYSPY
jgi:hypothetical protein